MTNPGKGGAFQRLSEALSEQKGKPPLDKWQPALSGDIDIEIRSDGQWYHEGSRFKRDALVRLFASILRREDDGHYYLVTPVEKWRIRVQDQPLRVIDFEVGDTGEQQLLLTVNTGEIVRLDAQHPLSMQVHDQQPEPLPVVQLWQGLGALVERSCWYRMIELGEPEAGRLWLRSFGERFDMGALQ